MSGVSVVRPTRKMGAVDSEECGHVFCFVVRCSEKIDAETSINVVELIRQDESCTGRSGV